MTSEVLAWAAVLIPLLLLNASPAVNGDAGSDYLDQKELEVSWIAGNASQANGNCGTTSSSSTLSGPRMPLAYMRLYMLWTHFGHILNLSAHASGILKRVFIFYFFLIYTSQV